MNTQKGFISIGILLAIILGVVVVGGGAYYMGHQNGTPQLTQNYPDISAQQQTQTQVQTTNAAPVVRPPTNTSTQTQNTKPQAPTVTIDKGTLISTSGNPTITGTATNINELELTFVSSAGVGYGGVGVNRAAKVTNGRWSLSAALGLPNGTYTVTVRPSDALDNGPLAGTGAVLTTATLTVQAQGNTSTNGTYTNSQYGFSVAYPADVSYTLNNPGRFSNGSVSFSVGSGQTGSGRLDMGFPLATSYCNVPKTDASHTAPTDLRTESIGGITFSVYTNTSASPTESYRQRIYQGLHGNDCYFFTEDIMGGSVLTSAQITAKLDAIVNSFRFTN